MRKKALYWTLLFLAIGFITPYIFDYYLAVFHGHIDPLIANVDSFAINSRSFLSLLLFSATCFLAAHFLSSSRLACIAIGGLIGFLVIIVLGQIVVWYPLYSYSNNIPSITLVLFVYSPFFSIAIAGLSIGLFLGWLVSLLPAFRQPK